MTSYQDKYTRYHDKPTKNGNPSSNNGWIYSAYSKYLAPRTYSLDSQWQCFRECVRSYDPLKIDRNPNDLTPPFSIDEVIGTVSLGFLSRHDLNHNYWNFCNLPEYNQKKITLKSVWVAARSLFNIRKKHRNYFWENNMTETYDLAFLVQPWHKYYINRHYKYNPTILQTVLFYLNSLFVLTKGNKSTKLILWLQLEDLNHWLLKFTKKDEWVRDYFDKEHPFVKGLK